MRFSVGRSAVVTGTLLFVVAAARLGQAADHKGVIEKIKARNQAASAAYTDGDFEKTKAELLEAIGLAKDNGLGTNRVLAQTYVLFGVLTVNEHKDVDGGARYFAKALEISPSAQVPPSMLTKQVRAAFAKAEDGKVTAADEPETAATPPPPPEKKSGGSAAEKRKADAEAKEREKERQAEEAEKARLLEELANAKVSESTKTAEKEKLRQEKQEREKALHDAKGFMQQLEKESAAKDKQLAEKDKQIAALNGKVQQLEKDKPEQAKQAADAKARLTQLEKDKADRDKWLAQVKESDKKEREAKEKLQQEKVEKDKQLAELKARLAQLEKDKAERDKWLAAAKDNEKKERENREKIEKAMGDVAARERERRARDEQERKEKAKLAEGPDMPGHIPEALYCNLPDEVQAGSDLYVHCVPRASVGAKMVTFHYRPSGAAVYNAAIMERSKKGWYMALIPGNKVSGKLLQYYVEARDGKQSIAANNGKATSPNIVSVKQAGGGKGR